MATGRSGAYGDMEVTVIGFASQPYSPNTFLHSYIAIKFIVNERSFGKRLGKSFGKSCGHNLCDNLHHKCQFRQVGKSCLFFYITLYACMVTLPTSRDADGINRKKSRIHNAYSLFSWQRIGFYRLQGKRIINRMEIEMQSSQIINLLSLADLTNPTKSTC